MISSYGSHQKNRSAQSILLLPFPNHSMFPFTLLHLFSSYPPLSSNSIQSIYISKKEKEKKKPHHRRTLAPQIAPQERKLPHHQDVFKPQSKPKPRSRSMIKNPPSPLPSTHEPEEAKESPPHRKLIPRQMPRTRYTTTHKGVRSQDLR